MSFYSTIFLHHTKVRLVKAIVFPVVMYGCESWTIKKAEYQRIDAFDLLCWRRLLRVPWTAKRYNQSILKEISPEYSLKDWCWSWNSNTLATWCKELTHWKRPWCWRKLKVEEKGTVGDDMVGWHLRLDGHEFEQALGVGDGQRSLACWSPWGWRVGHDWVTELDWTDTAWCTYSINLLLHIQRACCPKCNFNFRYLKGIASFDILLLMCIITNCLHQPLCFYPFLILMKAYEKFDTTILKYE